MDYELISPAELNSLPEEDDLAFVAAEGICRRNVARTVAEDQSERGSYGDEMRLQYITTISALASQFGVPNLGYPETNINTIFRDYADFARAAQAEVAKIMARNRRGKDALSVQLASKTRARIEQELDNLRRAVRKSDLPGRRRVVFTRSWTNLPRNCGTTVGLVTARPWRSSWLWRPTWVLRLPGSQRPQPP